MVKRIRLLIFVIARISLQNTNLHLEVRKSGLGAKLNVIKSQVLEKIKKTTIVSICNTGLKGNNFV